MPCLTIKEAADICGIPSKNIHTYIGRGKIVKRKDNLIDDTHPLNKDFFSKYNSSYIKETPIYEKPIKIELPKVELKTKVKELEQVKAEIIKPVKKQRTQNKPDTDSENDYSAFMSSQDLNKLKAEKLEQEIIQLTLKNQRLEGELIELDLIKRATFEVINAYRTTLFLAAENVLKNQLNDLGADNDRMTKAITDLSALFNAGCNDAIEGVKISIENLL